MSAVMNLGNWIGMSIFFIVLIVLAASEAWCDRHGRADDIDGPRQ